MTATVHTVTTEANRDLNDGSLTPMDDSYRWSCSCGAVGEWKPRMGQARQGGTLHARRKLGSGGKGNATQKER